jgi:hypothetical protein
MANDFYNVTGNPATSSSGSSSLIRSEFSSIASAFDKFPALTGGGTRILFINSGATAISTDSGFTFNSTNDILTVGSIEILGGTAPGTGWYQSATVLRTPNNVTIDQSLTVSGGQIVFPSTQNASSNVNTLDDYEEGSWTPVLTFDTPGNLSVSYTRQAGQYIKIGRLVFVEFSIVTSAFTHTTAIGPARITGLPFTASNETDADASGALRWGGITNASYTNVTASIPGNDNKITINASGSGVAVIAISATDMPTGGSVVLRGSVTYRAAS